MYIDAHSHIADLRFDSENEEFRRKILAQAAKEQIHFHLQGGVGPEDWSKQEQLKNIFPELGMVFGLHPYWIADHTDEECELALNELAKQLPRALALGELGLDLRPQILKDSFERQMHCFEQQLDLAEVAGKPIVLHLVRAFEQVQRVFFLKPLPSRGGFVHSFNGNKTEASYYLDLGMHLSFGGPLTRKDNHRLHQAFKAAPLDRILLETDSPDQPPQDYSAELNTPSTLWQVAEKAAEIKSLRPEQILDICSQNLRELVHL